MVRIMLIGTIFMIFISASPVKKNIYMWYIQEENLRLQEYSSCIIQASSISKTLREKQFNLQKCEEGNTTKADLLKEILQTKLAKIKPNGEGGVDNGVEQQQRARFLFKECISFAQSEEQIAECYREYNGTPQPKPVTTASAK